MLLLLLFIIFSGCAAHRGLWPPVALQSSAGYGLLWLCSPARVMASCGSAAQRGLWPLVALQPSAGYGLLWLCSPARVMASCGSAVQRGLWLPVALQSSAGYGLLWLCSPARAMASQSTRFLDHTTTRHSQYDSSGRVIIWSQRPLPDNTHTTNIPCPRWDSNP
jgi:hypothetical protein